MSTKEVLASGPLRALGLAGISGSHWYLLAVLGLLQIIDGFDLLAMAFAASSLSREWSLSPSALGLALSISSIGSVLGAVCVGYLADRFGRKPLLIVSTVTIGCSSLGAAFASDLWELIACRAVTGIALGAVSPLILGYSSEFFSERLRGRTSAILLSSIQLGQILGGGIAALVIPRFGWEAIFILGSVAPLALLPFLLRLPPSPSDLFRGKQDPQRAIEICHRYGIPAPGSQSDVPQRHGFIPLQAITSNGRTALFIAFVVAMLLGGSAGSFMNSWTPVLVEKRGAAVEVALLCLSFYHAGGVIGCLAMGWLMDQVSPYRLLPAAFLLSVVLLALLGFVPPVALVVHGLCFLIGLLLPSGLLSVMTLSTLSFPNALRVHVVACLVITARTAGFLAPVAGGFILSRDGTPMSLFMFAAALVFGCAASLLAGGRFVRANEAQAPVLNRIVRQ